MSGLASLQWRFRHAKALYSAVAQVLAYVYQLRAAMSGRVAMPGELPDLQVPRELDPHNKTTSAHGAEGDA